MANLLKLIEDLAKIPSFSSFEQVIHPRILELAGKINGCKVHKVPELNLILEIPGNKNSKPVALAAHLDKINHFGEQTPDEIPLKRTTSYFEGLLDDAVGLGIVLKIASEWEDHQFPPLYIFLSEMEESTGLREHPQLLRNGGKGLHHGIGAERICQYVLDKKNAITTVITVDTTPLFRGENGVALYGKHWEFTRQEPSAKELKATELVCEHFKEIDPDILISNNTNDYLHYGKHLNADKSGSPVVSVAIEPAIHPYHQAKERVFYQDIERVYNTVKTFLEEYQA